MPNIYEFKRILKDIQTGGVLALRKFHENHPEIHWSSLRYEKTGDTILHVASRLGHLDVVKYLIKNYEINSVNCKNNDNKTALHEAAQFAQHETAKFLMESGADVNALKKADWTPLMLACTKIDEVEIDENNYETVKLLLENGAEINYQNKDGWTALHLISREGDVRILELLIENGLDTRNVTKNGRTALHIAALHRRFDLTRKLLEIGLDVNSKDSCGNTPFHDAILSGNIKICNLLLENKADKFDKNKSDFTVLHLAACQGNIEIIEYITSILEIEVDVTTDTGLTPLHCAAKNKQLEAYNYLINKGSDFNRRDKFSRTPVDYLCM